MFQEHTPIESFQIGGRNIYVKRDDLYAAHPAPPLAKLRGLRLLLDNVEKSRTTLVGCFEASASRIGHGLAATCTHYPQLNCVVAYPVVKNAAVPLSAMAALDLGAKLLPIRSNIVTICYRQAAKVVEAEGGYMIPFGFECPEAVASVEKEASTVPIELIQNGTLVVACGSGVTLAGLLRGLKGRPSRIIGVSVGRSIKNILQCIRRCNALPPPTLEIRAPMYPYRKPMEVYCPFPCDRYYDLKAWDVLQNEIKSYREPIFFWNVGG